MSGAYPGKKLIGLTGNIAVGKSLVMKLLAELGAATIDADQVAHQVLRQDGAAHAPVVSAFGERILSAAGEINRAALGEIVFADAAALRQLEAITHPLIRQEIDRRVRQAPADVVVIEAIKLLEGELKDRVDTVWVVHASEPRQLARLLDDRGMPREEAERRIRAQNSQAEKLKRADLVITNEGDVAALRAAVARAWRDFKAAAPG